MVDINLAYNLIKAINYKAQIVIVGDKDQLESVSPGKVLNDLIESERIPTIALNKVYRQGEGSSIANLAHQIAFNDKIEMVNSNDISFLVKDLSQINNNVQSIIEKSYQREYSQLDVQVLFPMYKGVVGIDSLNEQLKPHHSSPGINS